LEHEEGRSLIAAMPREEHKTEGSLRKGEKIRVKM
jgi:hypothetical protein